MLHVLAGGEAGLLVLLFPQLAGLVLESVDQPVEALAVAVAAEVRQSGLGHGAVDQCGGVEHQTKSDPPSTLMLAPVT